MALYLYAVLAEPPRRGRRLRGIRREALRGVPAAGVLVVAGSVATAPGVSMANLRAHDAVVRRLAAVSTALLPVRFGTVVADARELRRLLAPRSTELRAALARVAGREQMTLRIATAPDVTVPVPRPPAGTGRGARYLVRRAREAATPGIAALRGALRRLVRDERVERHGAPPFVASVYHLVDRGQGAAYRAAARGAARRTPGLRVRVSGPWAPYAFTPDVLDVEGPG
ncbi:MAG TPA: GvpL/GvpF family gas vesicle protein [Solirubrobacteraceae bacterium]|nr:GvpL/GvpF family gas vesicle protein [Solirubrobacteraceae bacterium]